MAIDLFSIGKFTVHGYGLMIGIGFMLAVLLGARKATKTGLSADHVTNIAICTLVFGFLGGKLLFIIVEAKDFFSNPLAVLGSQGFVVYGGIISGVASICIYCLIKKISVKQYLDVIGNYVPLTQAFGRLGCFLAGCCYGRTTDAWYGVVFPEGCLAPAGVKLIPTQLIMAAGDFVIFVLLSLVNNKKKHSGLVASCYLMFYSIGRFIIEFLRNDYRGSVGFLSTSQFIAIWTFALGMVATIIIIKKCPEDTNITK